MDLSMNPCVKGQGIDVGKEAMLKVVPDTELFAIIELLARSKVLDS
jgi:hypothetical protein